MNNWNNCAWRLPEESESNNDLNVWLFDRLSGTIESMKYSLVPKNKDCWWKPRSKDIMPSIPNIPKFS